jgi:hypothetical protein
MQSRRKGALGVAILAVALATFSSAAASHASGFPGRVCALVTASAARAAGIKSQCVEQPQAARLSWASWGVRDGRHYLAVRISTAVSVMHPLAPTLHPIGPSWHGPIEVAPGIDAYYTESAYHGTPHRQGTMRFIAKASVVNVSLVDADAAVLPGLTSVAKSVARHM